MPGKRIFQKILGVNGAIIENVQYDDLNNNITIQVRPTKGKQHRCPICWRKMPFYDKGRGRRLWRGCDWNNRKVYLSAEAPRICCRKHGVLVAAVPWARHKSGFTFEFEQMTVCKALNCTRSATAREMRISWQTTGEIMSRVRASADKNPAHRFDNLMSIGIDETSYRKGHKYMTVVVNHEDGKLIWACDGYGKKVLSQFFEMLTEKQRKSIKYVTADGAKWIQYCIEKYCPNAIRCMDGFHVAAWATEALDKVRQKAFHDASEKLGQQAKRHRGRPRKDEILPAINNKPSEIKGAKYPLGKTPEHLTETQRAKLEMIAKEDKTLYRAYLWKEKLRLILHMAYEEACNEISSWIKGVRHCRIPRFVELGKKVARHKDAILATIRYGLSNARIEAVNNKIKLTIRMAYGFRLPENMIAMAMLRCSDIVIPMPWERLIIE